MDADMQGALRKRNTIWIGYDPRELDAFMVAKLTAERAAPMVQVRGLVLDDLIAAGLYTRETITKDGKLFDVVSGHPMSTEFAISRFFVPLICKNGWALFMDCDMMVRGNLQELFDDVRRKFADKAVVCVPHHQTSGPAVKMDGQDQSYYPRKNWSSFMFFNCEHPSNQRLTQDYLNSTPGRDLHAFSWLADHEIGHIGIEWNWLVNISPVPQGPICNVHFTEGVPSMKGHENDHFSAEWRDQLMGVVRGHDFMRRLNNMQRAQGQPLTGLVAPSGIVARGIGRPDGLLARNAALDPHGAGQKSD